MRSHRGAVLVVSGVLLVSLLGLPAAAAPGSGVDLAVTVEGPADNPSRGESFTVAITLANQGGAPASDVTLAAYVPDGLDLTGHAASSPGLTCASGEFGDFTCSLAALGAGEAVTLVLDLTRTMARETWIDAWGSTSEVETNFDNNYSGIFLEPDRSNPADVAVTVRQPAQPEPGEQFAYTATVTNRGPEIARSVTFTQSLSELVDYVSVASSDPTDTCTLHEETFDEEGVEGGPFVYREVRCSLGNMAFAEQATITVNVVRSDPHELWSSAWVGTSSWDANYENDWADAMTAGHPSVTSDLALTMTRSSAGTPLVGDDFEYVMTVTNLGPAAAPDAVASSWLPQEVALRSITSEDPAHKCEQDRYQGINCTIGALAVGDSASFTLALTRTRAREFWMGASVWSTNSDPNFENGYVEDHVAADKRVPADVGVTMDGPKNPDVGSTFDYVMTVTNNGPMAATGVFLASSVPDGATYVSSSSEVANACTLFEETYDDEMLVREGERGTYTYRELRCDLGTLAPGASTTVTMTVTRDSEYVLWGNSWVATASYDDNFDNDYASTPSEGKDFDGCAMPVEDGGGTAESRPIACDYAGGTETRGGSFYAPPSDGARKILMGRGSDTLTVKVTKSSKKGRELVINAGRGNDTVNILIAPGAGDISILVRGGRGRDHLQVSAPRPGTGLKIRMWGGDGRDICESQRGDRYRKRIC